MTKKAVDEVLYSVGCALPDMVYPFYAGCLLAVAILIAVADFVWKGLHRA